MRKFLSAILAAAMISSLFVGCEVNSGKETDKTTPKSEVTEQAKEENAAKHTLYFKDSSKSDKATATFFNSLSGKSEDIEMEKIGEDNEAVTFSCEGDCTAYNMAYVTCGGEKSREFAFNKCTSGWYKKEDYVLPYTEGEETKYFPELEPVTLTGYGFEKVVYIWTPDDYDASSDDKYSTIYVLDGQGVALADKENVKECPAVVEQVETMTSVTGKKAIVVAIESSGGRNYELVPEIGESYDEKEYNSKHDGDYSDEFECMNGTEFADFAANTLVPYIQKHYNVYTDALHTSIQGSSLGGLEAFYITSEYPEVFGTAGALSPSFWEYDDETWKEYLGKKSFDSSSPFIYLYTGSAAYHDTDPDVTNMYNRLKEMGYPEDKLVLHYNEKGTHSSIIWRSVFSEFLTAMMYQRVEPLQE